MKSMSKTIIVLLFILFITPSLFSQSTNKTEKKVKKITIGLMLEPLSAGAFSSITYKNNHTFGVGGTLGSSYGINNESFPKFTAFDSFLYGYLYYENNIKK